VIGVELTQGTMTGWESWDPTYYPHTVTQFELIPPSPLTQDPVRFPFGLLVEGTIMTVTNRSTRASVVLAPM